MLLPGFSLFWVLKLPKLWLDPACTGDSDICYKDFTWTLDWKSIIFLWIPGRFFPMSTTFCFVWQVLPFTAFYSFFFGSIRNSMCLGIQNVSSLGSVQVSQSLIVYPFLQSTVFAASLFITSRHKIGQVSACLISIQVSFQILSLFDLWLQHQQDQCFRVHSSHCTFWSIQWQVRVLCNFIPLRSVLIMIMQVSFHCCTVSPHQSVCLLVSAWKDALIFSQF